MWLIKTPPDFHALAQKVQIDPTAMRQLANDLGRSQASALPLPLPIPKELQELEAKFYSEVFGSIEGLGDPTAVDKRPRWGPSVIRIGSEAPAEVSAGIVVVNVILPFQGDGKQIASPSIAISLQKGVLACISRRPITEPIEDVTTVEGEVGDIVILDKERERLYSGAPFPELYVLAFVYPSRDMERP